MGKDSPHFPDGVFLYTTHMMSMAAYYLYKLYLARKEVENIDCSEWKRSALGAMDYLVDKVRPDGMVGRNYTEEGKYDDICANAWLLIALDYFHSQTRDGKFDDARRKMESWVERTFSGINHWYNWSADGGFWLGDGFPPINHDAFEIPTYATYCMYRYMKTKEKGYLQRAKDAIEYLWLCMIPIQYPGYSHITKGLVKEQDTYSTYDVPFNTIRLFDCFPYLSVIEDNDFYMLFYKLMLQLQMAYQAVDRKFPAFYIGLDWIKEDALGEEEVAYISEFAGCILVASINSPYCYRYIRGKDSRIGLDYEPGFDAGVEDGDIVIAYSTCSVRSCVHDTGKHSLDADLAGRTGRDCVIGIRWNRSLFPVESTKILVNRKREIDAAMCFDSSTGIAEFNFTLPADKKILIELSCAH